jgi:hypothetical protein
MALVLGPVAAVHDQGRRARVEVGAAVVEDLLQPLDHRPGRPRSQGGGWEAMGGQQLAPGLGPDDPVHADALVVLELAHGGGGVGPKTPSMSAAPR